MTALTVQSKIRRIKFSFSPTHAGRIHYLTADDVRVLLGRLPEELWERLRAVHFNDQSRGRRTAGYVNMGHREIAICAFPASVSCTPFTSRKKGSSPATFGAFRGRQWPRLAVRRYLLYNTFLHELVHLQLVDPSAKRVWRRFACESLAQDFANRWRRTLWEQHFDHPDPVHNAAQCRRLGGWGEGSMKSSSSCRSVSSIWFACDLGHYRMMWGLSYADTVASQEIRLPYSLYKAIA